MTKEEEIINAVVDKLGGNSSGAAVYPMRYKYADLSDLPMICVYDAQTDSNNAANAAHEERLSFIEVLLFAYGPQSPATRDEAADTKLHTLRGDVETLLGGMYDDLGVDGVVQKEYLGYKIIDDKNNKDSESLVLTCAMRYSFKYFNELAPL